MSPLHLRAWKEDASPDVVQNSPGWMPAGHLVTLIRNWRREGSEGLSHLGLS